MKTISIDIETFSSADLTKTGVYRYVEAEDFEILLFGYAIDGGDVKVIDIARGEKLPEEIINALLDESVKKFAYNAQFERICLSRFLGYPTGKYLDPKSWYCTMVWAATLGLPLSLEKVGEVLGLEKQKLSVGKDLIRYFCKPCEPTVINGQRTRNYPRHDLGKWETFKSYNKRDVETEMEIQKRLSSFPVLETEWENYHLDQRINDYGIALDMDFVEHAIECDEVNSGISTEKAKALTGIDNPNSPAQLKAWLIEQGQIVESLSKAEVNRLLQDATGNIEEILRLRQELAKSSVKKYIAMKNAVCADGRARGLLQFYGANRTGRFAGRLIQVQNLPQNHLDKLAEARELVRRNAYSEIESKYGNIPSVLSELIRTAFVAKDGHRFIVADFSAIEARVIAWYAGEDWRLDVFKNGGDIYCASASQMFKVNVVKNGENGHLRQKGKIAELALGYGGSVGALIGSVIDSGDSSNNLSMIEQVSQSLNEGEVALVALAMETGTEMLDARLQPYQVTIIRQDAAIVAQEVEEAKALQKEMETEAKTRMREAKKAERKQDIEEKREKIRADFEAFKNRFSKN